MEETEGTLLCEGILGDLKPFSRGYIRRHTSQCGKPQMDSYATPLDIFSKSASLDNL